MFDYRTLARHSSHYFAGNVLGIAAGLISLPIFTRILSREDYGHLSLILLSVSFLATFARLGIPQSIARHLPEYKLQGLEAYQGYVTTIVAAAGGTAVLAAVCGGLVSLAGPVQEGAWGAYLPIIGILIGSEIIIAVIAEFYRAQLKSALSAMLRLAVRYTTLVGSLVFFFFVSEDLRGFLQGKVIAQIVTPLLFAVPLMREARFIVNRIDMKIVWEAVRYGLPLSLAASGGFFIAYGDRYVIQTLLGAEEVARYSLPYDLLYQIEEGLTTPLRLAVVPIVFSLLAAGDSARAQEVLSEVVRAGVLLVVPLLAGISLLSRDLVVLVATEKYADSSSLMPVLGAGIFLGGFNFLLTIGLTYQKRTKLIAALTLSFGAINVVANALLIPVMGVMGSAVATLATYSVYVCVSYSLTRKALPVQLYPWSMLRAVVASSFMVVVLWFVRGVFSTPLSTVLVLVPLGFAVYLTAILVLERDARDYLVQAARRRRVVPTEAT